MAMGIEPDLALAERVLPPPLLRALRHVFAQRISGCMLVGGTALAGFYAGHRRSDDLDLFAEDDGSQRMAALAVRSLEGIGAGVEVRQDSAVYFRALCALEGHRFTVDVATASALFKSGRSVRLPGDILVADLDTLLMLKGAALVSRCAEKDLYDLLWILERKDAMTLRELAQAAQRFDAGASPENLLISVLGARLDMKSCDFSLDQRVSARDIHRQVSGFRKELALGLRAIAKGNRPEPLGDLVRRVRALSKR